MSELGQERHFGRPDPMSVLPPLATVKATSRAVAMCQERKSATSFDYLVGATKQRQWEGKTERLGGLEIDNELDFCKQLDRKV